MNKNLRDVQKIFIGLMFKIFREKFFPNFSCIQIRNSFLYIREFYKKFLKVFEILKPVFFKHPRRPNKLFRCVKVSNIKKSFIFPKGVQWVIWRRKVFFVVGNFRDCWQPQAAQYASIASLGNFRRQLDCYWFLGNNEWKLIKSIVGWVLLFGFHVLCKITPL